MTPEQDKELVEVLRAHMRTQKYLLMAIAIPGIVIALVGGLTLMNEL